MSESWKSLGIFSKAHPYGRSAKGWSDGLVPAGNSLRWHITDFVTYAELWISGELPILQSGESAVVSHKALMELLREKKN